MNIFFVRHAQSESNIDPNVLKIQTNMSVNLSDVGKEQAQETAQFLYEHSIENYKSSNLKNIKIWNSPYNRTRQTAQIIKEYFNNHGLSFLEEESIYIAERQFGLVDDVKDYHLSFPYEANHYNLHKESKHDFFARPPLGESPYDMCIRLDFFLRVILANESHIDNHIIVSHGAAIRGLILMHQKQTFEHYNSPNPANASVRQILQNKYIGEVFCPSKETY